MHAEKDYHGILRGCDACNIAVDATRATNWPRLRSAVLNAMTWWFGSKKRAKQS